MLSTAQTDLNRIDRLLAEEESVLAFNKGQEAALLGMIESLKQQTAVEDAKINLYAKCVKVLQGVSENMRDTVLRKIESVVSEALSEIYGRGFAFVIKLESQKSSQTLTFNLRDQAGFEYNILTSFGGGIKDIISTVLRIIVVELHIPKITGPIILDETGRNISKEYQSNFGNFLSILSHKLGRQIILVSHQIDVIAKADRTISVALENSRSAVTVRQT